MLSRSFFFIRHGETDWNVAQKLQGHTDIPLNATGRAQARASREILRSQRFDRIVASPLSRARETAEIINEVLSLPLSFHEGLRERGFGVLEGVAHDEANARRLSWVAEGRPVEENGTPCPDGAEPYAAFGERIFRALKDELSATPDQAILFVSHGGVYRALLRGLFGEATQSPNAAPFLFERSDDTWSLRCIGSGEIKLQNNRHVV